MAENTPIWPEIDFDADPRFILGGRGTDHVLWAHRIEVKASARAILSNICQREWAKLRETERRVYEPYAALERGEQHFALEIGNLPDPVRRRRLDEDAVDDHEPATARLVELVRDVDTLDPLGADDLDGFRYLFYGICFPTSDGNRVGFVKKSNPRASLGPKHHFMHLDDRLELVATPDIALDDDIDVFVTPTLIATTNGNAFKDLLNDVQIALQAVAANVKMVRRKLSKKVPLSAGAATALEQAARKKVSYARRLHLLPSRIDAVDLSPENILAECKHHGIESLVNENGKLDFNTTSAGLFLDLVEGRYFEDAFGNERRRADRFSRR